MAPLFVGIQRMSTGHSSWLTEFAAAARRTDRFVGSADHAALLSAGLLGEAGSMIAELKKEKREREAYPAYRHRMREEIGDVLWYFVRLADVLVPDLLPTIQLAEVPAVASGGRLADAVLAVWRSRRRVAEHYRDWSNRASGDSDAVWTRLEPPSDSRA